jgi:hypothetical protein
MPDPQQTRRPGLPLHHVTQAWQLQKGVLSIARPTCTRISPPKKKKKTEIQCKIQPWLYSLDCHGGHDPAWPHPSAIHRKSLPSPLRDVTALVSSRLPLCPSLIPSSHNVPNPDINSAAVFQHVSQHGHGPREFVFHLITASKAFALWRDGTCMSIARPPGSQ